ncbi:MAG: (d)CMP kinase [Anaerolineae bacterium]|nr:(d)CMP kinase [Anaerolineae bacterium]
MPKITVAIDGPAASGKSTVAGILAERLGYLYFDTGVMYRAVTWAALARGIPIEDERAITRLAEELRIEVLPPTVDDGRQYTVLADGQDITWKIREAQVNRYVSPVSAYKGVRRALTLQQRRIGAPGGVIMVGRDIGTVVLPEAQVKIYLDASLEERTRRRYLEYRQRGILRPFREVKEELVQRDRIDSTREMAPLRPAEDAVIVDSTCVPIDKVVRRIERVIRQALEQVVGG